LPFTTLIFSANDIPKIDNESNTFARRFEMIEWNKAFYGEDRDHTIKTILKDPLTAGPATSLGMLTAGTKMKMCVSPPKSGELMNVIIDFENSKHVNYDLMVTQNGNLVLMK
jgi:hypothetical protein